MSLGVLCPGQGSQDARMLDLLWGEALAQPLLAQAEHVLEKDLRALVESPVESRRNRNAQPLLCATQLATWTVLRPLLPTPRVYAGYSVGELAAYGCAGALSGPELIGLARARAGYMDAANTQPTEMLAVRGLARSQIDALCERFGAEVAIVNAIDRFVLGMQRHQSEGLRHAARALGAGVTPLAVELASHTSWLAVASRAFQAELEESGLIAPAVPVLGGIDGMPVYRRDAAIPALARQISTALDWAACMQSLVEFGCSVLLELGPGNTLTRMVREAFPGLTARSVAEFHSLPAVADWVGRRLQRV